MNTSAQELATRLTANFNGGQAGSAQTWLWRPLLGLLAAGVPVSIDQLAATTSRTPEEIRQVLSGMPDTEYDDDGRVIGSGLTQRPTSHHLNLGGKQLYTWCALDTLIFPTVLGQPANITSPCHATGQPIQLTVEPRAVTRIEPASAVVSILTPDDLTSIRSSFCNQVHFFATPDAAKGWLGQHPGATVLPVTEAYELARPLADALLAGETPSTCC